MLIFKYKHAYKRNLPTRKVRAVRTVRAVRAGDSLLQFICWKLIGPQTSTHEQRLSPCHKTVLLCSDGLPGLWARADGLCSQRMGAQKTHAIPRENP